MYRDHAREQPDGGHAQHHAAADLDHKAVTGISSGDEERVVEHAVYHHRVAGYRDAYRLDGDGGDLLRRAEEIYDRMRGEGEREADRHRYHAADDERRADAASHAIKAAPSVVEGEEGDERVVDPHQGVEGEVLDAQPHHPAGDGDVAVGRRQNLVDGAHAEGDAAGGEGDGKSDRRYPAPYPHHAAARPCEEGEFYFARLAQFLYQVEGAGEAPGEGGRRRARHAPAEREDEDRVQDKVQPVGDKKEV